MWGPGRERQLIDIHRFLIQESHRVPMISSCRKHQEGFSQWQKLPHSFGFLLCDVVEITSHSLKYRRMGLYSKRFNG